MYYDTEIQETLVLDETIDCAIELIKRYVLDNEDSECLLSDIIEDSIECSILFLGVQPDPNDRKYGKLYFNVSKGVFDLENIWIMEILTDMANRITGNKHIVFEQEYSSFDFKYVKDIKEHVFNLIDEQIVDVLSPSLFKY